MSNFDLVNKDIGDEPSVDIKRKIIESLIRSHEIVMLWDENKYRPLWKREWDIQEEVKSEQERDNDNFKYSPYVAGMSDIEIILENGDLEWEWDGNTWYVKIWW